MVNLAALNTAMGALTTSRFVITRPYIMRKCLNNFLSDNNMTYSVESGITWICVLGVHDIDPADYLDSSPAGEVVGAFYLPPPPGAGATGAAAVAPTRTNWNGTGAVPAGTFEDGVNPDEFASLIASRDSAKKWVFDLTACYQVKELNAGNVSNYFSGVPNIKISGRMIVPLLRYTASKYPNLLSDATARGHLSDNVFIKYHTAYASTPRLCKEMMGAATAITNLLFSDADRALVDTADTNYYSSVDADRIPLKVKACCHAYLSAFNRLPDNWYQGDKAKNDYPATLYSQMHSIWKKYKELSTGSEAMAGATDEAALIAAIPSGIRSS